MGEDGLAMSQRERDRLKLPHEVSQGQLPQSQAESQIGLSTRQVRRLINRWDVWVRSPDQGAAFRSGPVQALGMRRKERIHIGCTHRCR